MCSSDLEGLPEVLGPRGPPPGPGPSGASQAAGVAIHNKVAERSRAALVSTEKAEEAMRQWDLAKTRAVTRFLARGGVQRSALETLHRTTQVHAPVPADFIHAAQVAELEGDTTEIEHAQGAAQTAFTEGARPLGKRGRRKHPVLVEDVVHPGSQRVDVDDLAYAMINQASSAKHLSDQWMQLSAHNQVMGTRYAEIVAHSLLQGQAMSNHNLLELARLKARVETEAHLAGVQERKGYLDMMAAVFGRLNEHLSTSVGSLSVQGQLLQDLNSGMRDVQMAQAEAAEKQREFAAEVEASSRRPPPPPPGGERLRAGKRVNTLPNEMVTEIPHTDPEEDAAMDRAVVIARSPPPLEIHREKLRATSAKIRKITEPELIPEEAIPPEAARGRYEPQRSRLFAERRAGPYGGRPKQAAITDKSYSEHTFPPLSPSPSPPPPAAVLPTNGPHKTEDYAQLREATEARSASASDRSIPASSRSIEGRSISRGSRSRSRGQFAKYQIVPWKPESSSNPMPGQGPSGKPPSPSPEGAIVPYRAAARVMQRSSARSRTPHGQGQRPSAPTVPEMPILRIHDRPSSQASAQTARQVSAGDYARGNTPDKRFKGALGEVRRIARPRGGLNRRARSALLQNIRNRD